MSKIELPALDTEDVGQIEDYIDRMNDVLPPLKSFIIPGGHPAVSCCHVVRTVCRRAERAIVRLSENESVPDVIIMYLNRISDFLFVFSRSLSFDYQIDEIKWKPKFN